MLSPSPLTSNGIIKYLRCWMGWLMMAQSDNRTTHWAWAWAELLHTPLLFYSEIMIIFLGVRHWLSWCYYIRS